MKDLIYISILGVVLSLWSLSGSLTREDIMEKDMMISSLAARLQERAATPDRVIISCANNEKDYIKALRNTEKRHNLPSGLLVQVAYVESNFDPRAVSHKGAVGIMQIHPKWHPDVNPRDPYASIEYAANYLLYLKNRFHGDWKLALAAWNWGEGNVANIPIEKAPKETKNFIKRVMAGVNLA